MKKLLLFSFIIISNFANGQIEKNTHDQPVSPSHKRSAYDIYLEIKDSIKVIGILKTYSHFNGEGQAHILS